MIKKYSKLLLVFFCAFFVAITPSFAREVTLDELNDLVDETLEYSDAVSGIYIIGEYAYTSEWVLTTQDTMLAARSINTNAPGKTNKDEIYGAMTIHSYTRTTDSNWNYNGFTADKNLVGTTASADKVSIKYLDYVFIPEETKAIISSDISAADLEALKNAFGYDRTNSNTDVKLVVEDGKINDIILLAEALHEKKIANIADEISKRKIFKILKECNEKGVTILNITHDLNESLYGNDIVLLQGGKVLLHGSKEDVLKQETKLKRAGLELPFLADLSIRLMYYGILDHMILDMDEMVNAIWK